MSANQAIIGKRVHKYDDIREDIIKAVDTICNPIKETISPKGLNVIFENAVGDFFATNDGATVAKNISVVNPVQNGIIEIIKSASLRTNNEVGDGTSTTVLLSQILIKEAFRLIDSGYNPIDIKKEFESFRDIIVEALRQQKLEVKGDDDLSHIATISANNDSSIAKDIVQTINTAGLDGMVFIEANHKPETKIIEDTGFIIDSGLFRPELKNAKDRFVSTMNNPIVFITDKRLYYPEEAETILKTALSEGYKNIVVVARDFIGQAPNVFISNHVGGVANILLVKDITASDTDNSTLEDLATYLGGKVVSEKSGSLVNKITIKDFCVASKVFADVQKTILSTQVPNNKNVKERIKAIRAELENDSENDTLKRRLASLTTGMVTIKVGGQTQIEMNEKMFRYEDAINAVRSAKKDGYLVGGGVALLRAFENVKDQFNPDFSNTYRKLCQGNVRQIAINCGKHTDSIIEAILTSKDKYLGYNALSDKMENLLKAGVIDPFKVTEMAVRNAVSIVGQIIGSGYIIVNQYDKDESEGESRN